MEPPLTAPVRQWLLQAAGRIDAALGQPRVRRVVLPPEQAQPGKESEFCAVQLEDGSTGLAFTLLEGTLEALHARPRWQAGMPALELALGFAAADGAARALGLAAINALARALHERAGFVPAASSDSFGALDLRPGDRLGLIGYFGPLVRQARALDIPVVVLELRPELVREEPGLVVTLDAGRLGACNKLLATSSVLLNDTLDHVAASWRHAQSVALVGPSAGCPPDPLFAVGVSAVGGTWVTDGDALLERIASGQPWGEAARKFTLTAQAYPGLDRLLARAAHQA